MSALHSRITDPVLRRVVQPQNILEMGMAFWSTRVVVAAVEFGVFTQLAARPLSGQELMDKPSAQRALTTCIAAPRKCRPRRGAIPP
jgi:hypothetical protein